MVSKARALLFCRLQLLAKQEIVVWAVLSPWSQGLVVAADSGWAGAGHCEVQGP